MVLLGVEKNDDMVAVSKMANRLLAYRIFSDDDGKMNCNVKDIGGEILLVSQFTLAAETSKGLRPGFSRAAPPAQALPLYDAMIKQLSQSPVRIATGRFGADMQVHLINDGPVTFLLEL